MIINDLAAVEVSGTDHLVVDDHVDPLLPVPLLALTVVYHRHVHHLIMMNMMNMMIMMKMMIKMTMMMIMTMITAGCPSSAKLVREDDKEDDRNDILMRVTVMQRFRIKSTSATMPKSVMML